MAVTKEGDILVADSNTQCVQVIYDTSMYIINCGGEVRHCMCAGVQQHGPVRGEAGGAGRAGDMWQISVPLAGGRGAEGGVVMMTVMLIVMLIVMIKLKDVQNP